MAKVARTAAPASRRVRHVASEPRRPAPTSSGVSQGRTENSTGCVSQ